MSDGKPGWKERGADTLNPFRSDLKIIESYDYNSSKSAVNSVSKYPSYTTSGRFAVQSENARLAIISFSAFVYNGRTGYWQILKNNEIVSSYSDKGETGNYSPLFNTKTFVIEVKKGDIIEMQIACSSADGNWTQKPGYIADICE